MIDVYFCFCLLTSHSKESVGFSRFSIVTTCETQLANNFQLIGFHAARAAVSHKTDSLIFDMTCPSHVLGWRIHVAQLLAV